MTAWILSIAGVTILSVVVDLILPSGQTAKYIKNIFAFVMILVIISPLPALIKGNFNVNDIFESEEIVLQEDYIYQVNRDKLTALEEEITSSLEEKGIKNVVVTINADIFQIEMKILEVNVDLSDLVIDENSGHIDIEKAITEVVNRLVGEEVIIIFNE
ncbi:MAG TPA: stage III sporulation protein AF [Candidatus Caccopulliclostridium gallistercoris]|uniref:Stage III sporulation protein AF n=1 Tax=Candidatus Caccopulliclostridium gallistercoris TaxID=2840719 RepID=A0A9D1SZ80_9FIRM|nr:stage III sporulation protein AF [Candidatus Caccopulliclostridium gallistercoris]